MQNNKWLEFITGNNTLLIDNENDFNKFKEFLEYLNLSDVLNKYNTYSEWEHLAKINNYDYGYIIFEFQPYKGLTFGYTKESSKNWYGDDPLTIKNIDLVEKVKKNILNRKIEKFNELCGDWDFRNIDMTQPHLQSIEINGEYLETYCEKFDVDIDDYISCKSGIFFMPDFKDRFNKLDIDNELYVDLFINEIDSLIDWDKINEILNSDDKLIEEYNSITYVDQSTVTKYVDSWINHEKLPIKDNLLYTKIEDKYMAVDNQTGICFVEEFDSEEDTFNWLLRKNLKMEK